LSLSKPKRDAINTPVKGVLAAELLVLIERTKPVANVCVRMSMKAFKTLSFKAVTTSSLRSLIVRTACIKR